MISTRDSYHCNQCSLYLLFTRGLGWSLRINTWWGMAVIRAALSYMYIFMYEYINIYINRIHSDLVEERRPFVNFLIHNLIFLAGNVGWFSGNTVVNCATLSFHFLATHKCQIDSSLCSLKH